METTGKKHIGNCRAVRHNLRHRDTTQCSHSRDTEGDARRGGHNTMQHNAVADAKQTLILANAEGEFRRERETWLDGTLAQRG